MLNAKYGLHLTGDDIGALGQKVLGMETDFRLMVSGLKFGFC